MSSQVYYVVKVAENFVESKAKNFSIAVATFRFFNEAISKIIKTWYNKNMLDLIQANNKPLAKLPFYIFALINNQHLKRRYL